jgi:hypothetical protein
MLQTCANVEIGEARKKCPAWNLKNHMKRLKLFIINILWMLFTQRGSISGGATIGVPFLDKSVSTRFPQRGRRTISP